MGRFIQAIVGLVGVVVLVVVAAAIFLWTSLDSLVETAVEDLGSEVTRTSVTLNEAEVSLTEGKATLTGLEVGNPVGYRTDRALFLSQVNAAVDLDSIGGDVLVIDEIVVERPDVTYELDGPQGSNFDAIQANIDAYMAARKEEAAEESAEADPDTSQEPRLIIRNLYIRDGNVRVSASVLQGETVGVPLPEIHLTDIGGKSGGATPGQVADRILGAVGDAATRAVRSIDLDRIGGTVKGAAEGAKGAAEGAVEGVGGAIKGVLGD